MADCPCKIIFFPPPPSLFNGQSLIFFRLLLSNCLNWKIYCDDPSSLSSRTAVQNELLLHISMLSGAFIVDIISFCLFLCCLEGQKACSCYTFEGEMADKMLNWKKANESCEATNKHLVVMETEREWRFITDEIGKLDTKYSEWHIGLFNASGNWTWINGKPLTFNKWLISEPGPEDLYGLIHKDFP